MAHLFSFLVVLVRANDNGDGGAGWAAGEAAMVLGIDVSHYTGKRDWQCLVKLGIEFAYIKATEGSTVKDDMFERHRASMRAAGVQHGAYHFAHPGSAAVAQAAHFCSVVGKLAATDLQPVLDLEVGDGQPAEKVVDWTLAFLDAAEASLGTRFIVYTGGFWRRALGNPECAPLGERRLWTARYGGAPVLPRPWKAWSIWQFSDGIHSCPPEAAKLKSHCDWNRLADGLEVADLTVAANPIVKARPKLVEGWPGRVFVFPSQPAVTGDDVRKWQACMAERGWAVAVDGEYGPQSRKACVSLQRQLGLEPDGIVGPATWRATLAE
jgi:lysozyme